MLFLGGKGPISFSLISDYGPPPCAPDRPFPLTPKDKLEPPTPSVYVRMHFLLLNFIFLLLHHVQQLRLFSVYLYQKNDQMCNNFL